VEKKLHIHQEDLTFYDKAAERYARALESEPGDANVEAALDFAVERGIVETIKMEACVQTSEALVTVTTILDHQALRDWRATAPPEVRERLAENRPLACLEDDIQMCRGGWYFDKRRDQSSVQILQSLNARPSFCTALNAFSYSQSSLCLVWLVRTYVGDPWDYYRYYESASFETTLLAKGGAKGTVIDPVPLVKTDQSVFMRGSVATTH
jgi:hypothetical protein